MYVCCLSSSGPILNMGVTKYTHYWFFLKKKKEIKLVKSELFCILFCFTFEKSVWWEPKAVKCLKYEADYSLIVITKVIFTNAYKG